MRAQRAQFRVSFNQLVQLTANPFETVGLHPFFQVVNIRLFLHFPLLLGDIITAAGDRAIAVRHPRATADSRRQRGTEILSNLNKLFRA